MNIAADNETLEAERERARLARARIEERVAVLRGEALLNERLRAKVREARPIRERVRSWVQDFCI